MLPKFRKLIYEITTDSLWDGNRIEYSPYSQCPFCNTTLDRHHMFSTCPVYIQIQQLLLTLAQRHWPQYTSLEFNDIPTLLSDYNPISIFHIITLWAMWRSWSSYMFDNDNRITPVDRVKFIKTTITYIQIEFVQRIYEMCPVIQWLQVLDQRSDTHIPEKEFLLIHTQKIKTNPDKLIMINGEIHPKIKEWIGTGYLISVEQSHHRPRLRINYQPWSPHNLPPGVGIPQPLSLAGQGIARPTVVGAEAAALGAEAQ